MTRTSWKLLRGFLAAGLLAGVASTCLAHGGHGGGGGHVGGGGAHFGGGHVGGGHVGGMHFGGGGMRMGGGGMHLGGGIPRSSIGTATHFSGPRGGFGGTRSISPQIGGSPLRGSNMGGANLGRSLPAPRGAAGLSGAGSSFIRGGSLPHAGQLNGSRAIPNLYNASRATSLGAGRTLHSPQIGNARGNLLGLSGASGLHVPTAGVGNIHNVGNFRGPNGLVGSHNNFLHAGGAGSLANVHRLPYAGNSMWLGNRNVNLAGAGYRPSYYRHPFYHGYWRRSGFGSGFWLGYGLGSFGNGWGWGLGNVYAYNRYGYGFGGYGYQPYGWGYGGWGLGSLAYGSGYLSYYNPYCMNGYGAGVYDYSQPIPVTYNPPASDLVASADPTAAVQPDSAERQLETAISAFRQKNYDAAIDTVDHAIAAHPDDAVLHEFRSLVLFARGDYQQAAATIHSVLAVGPGWDWDTLSSIYTDADDYTPQLRALEAYTVKYPDDAASSFLLAYHYLCDGHPEAALRELKTVVRLKPDDRVAAELLRMISAPPVDPNASGTPTPPVPMAGAGSASTPVAAGQLAGEWSASRSDGSTFRLNLQPDRKFTWTFSSKQGPPTTLEGTYSIDGSVLALERKDGGSLIAEVTGVEGKKFHFKLAGAPQDDPGLDFLKP